MGAYRSEISLAHSGLSVFQIILPDYAKGIHGWLDVKQKSYRIRIRLSAGLATTWSKESDGRSYVFNIRSGVQFHDSDLFGNASREVTASDVVYSISVLAKEASDDFFRATVGGRILGAEDFRHGDSEKLAGLEAIDDYTLRIKLTKEDDSFLQVLAMPAFGVIPENTSDGDDSETVGAGPFSLTEEEEAVTLIRNPNYFREDEFGNRLPYIDTIRFVEVDQNSERLEALFNGEIDVVSDLELDPVRDILESHMQEFSGENPKFIMKREQENASYDTYLIYRSTLRGLGSGFMGYRDYSQVQIEQ